MEEYENYEEVEAEMDSEFTSGDVIFCIGFLIVACFVFAFVMHHFKKSIKNMHLKIGNKIELGLETKDDTKENQESK